MDKVEKGKRYRTRGNVDYPSVEVQILETELSAGDPVLYVYSPATGGKFLRRVGKNGIDRRSCFTGLSPWDLIEIKPKVKGYVAISFVDDKAQFNTARVGRTKDEAVENLRILACLPADACIEIEVEQGQGLD